MTSSHIIIKITDGKDIRRYTSAVDALSYASTHKRAAEIFGIHKFQFLYKDDEGDMITISTEEEMAEAVSLALKTTEPASLRLAVLRLTIKPIPTKPSAPPDFKVPGGCDNLMNNLAKDLPDLMSRLPEAVQKLIPNAELDIEATLAATAAAAGCGLAKASNEASRDDLGFHPGVTCDKSGQSPIIGNRYHMKGENYDLTESEYNKLTGSEKEKFELIPPPRRFGCKWSNGYGSFGCGRANKWWKDPSKMAARFVSDVTIHDGTQVAPGTKFTKIWKLKNTGEMAWPLGSRLLFVGGDQMGAELSIPISTTGPVLPNQDIDVAIDLLAPIEIGRYLGYWRLTGPMARKKFGQRIWCHIQVVDPNAATAAPTEGEVAEAAHMQALAQAEHEPEAGTSESLVPGEANDPAAPAFCAAPAAMQTSVPELGAPVKAPVASSVADAAFAPPVANESPEVAMSDAGSEWDSMLDDLAEMGFQNRELCKELMIKHNGSINHTVKDLVGDLARP